MLVGDLITALSGLPDSAEVFVMGEQSADSFFGKADKIVRVDRLLLNRGCKGQGGVVVAGVLRVLCEHLGGVRC